jgi:maltokinase
VIDGVSRALAERLLGRPFVAERAVAVDQTNASVVVDETVIVKWLRPPVPAPHPGVTLIRHLERAGFTEMPELLAVDERDGVVHAIVSRYVPGAVDGWDWLVDDVDRSLAGSVSVESVIAGCARLGAITARLHAALADLQPGTADLVAVADQALADLGVARSQLDGLSWLDPAAVAAALQPLRQRSAPGQRIHGDLHAGQFLRSGATILVTDFDGNPMRDLEARARPQSPLADVAALLQSIVHVGAVVVRRRRPDRAADVDPLVAAAVAAALEAYGAQHHVDGQLLHAFRVAQELHEYAYSIEHLPHWRYVADDALPRLLGGR